VKVFVLDTDHLGIIQDRTEPAFSVLTSRMRLHRLEEFYVTIVSFQEQVAGWNLYIQRARDVRGLVRGYSMFQRVLTDFAEMNVLPLTDNAGNEFVRLRKSGVRVGTMDLRIGSIALVHDFTVLTRNTVDFERITGLRVDDWTRPLRPR
jgi:tRNA(fMet)-specific endonuclease VapC